MCKWTRSFVSILFSLLATIASASAADLSLGTWHTTGLQTWRTSFPLHTTIVDGASELSYPHTGNYLIVNYENKLSPKQSLQIEAATTVSSDNHVGSDSDWDYSKTSALWYYGNFDTHNKSSFFTINWKHHNNNHTDFFWGYTYDANQYSMTNGLYTIDNYNPVHTTLDNLNSQYTMVYQGPHVGVTYKAPLTNSIHAIASVTYSPLTLAQGYGWWNLRELTFKHTGFAEMLDTTIGLEFSPNPKYPTIALGYRYQYYSLYKGRENLSTDISWNRAVNIQKGYYLTGNMLF